MHTHNECVETKPSKTALGGQRSPLFRLTNLWQMPNHTRSPTVTHPVTHRGANHLVMSETKYLYLSLPLYSQPLRLTISVIKWGLFYSRETILQLIINRLITNLDLFTRTWYTKVSNAIHLGNTSSEITELGFHLITWISWCKATFANNRQYFLHSFQLLQ